MIHVVFIFLVFHNLQFWRDSSYRTTHNIVRYYFRTLARGKMEESSKVMWTTILYENP